MNLSDRIKAALNHADMSGSELAKIIKTTPSTVSDWVTGATKSISAKHGFPAALALNVNAQWLITGQGNMLDGVASNSDKELIFKCLSYVLEISPNINPDKLLLVGKMLFNASRKSKQVDKKEAEKLLSIVD